MNGLAALLIAWASLAGCASWAWASDTRALGVPRFGRGGAWARAACLVILQCGLAVSVLGWAGGLALVGCAWMLLGGLYVAALNGWPAATQRWAWRTGWAALALAACSVAMERVIGEWRA